MWAVIWGDLHADDRGVAAAVLRFAWLVTVMASGEGGDVLDLAVAVVVEVLLVGDAPGAVELLGGEEVDVAVFGGDGVVGEAVAAAAAWELAVGLGEESRWSDEPHLVVKDGGAVFRCCRVRRIRRGCRPWR